MTKRALSWIIAASMLLSMGGCVSQQSPTSVIEGEGQILLESSSAETPFYEPESPPADPESSLDSSSSQVPSSAPPVSSSASADPSVSGSVSSSQASSQSVPSSSSASSSESSEPDDDYTPAPLDEVRAVWLSYLDLGPMLTNKTQAQFTSSIRSAFQKLSDMGMNTVYAQVRPFGDALYPSEYFPQSYLFTGTEGGVGEVPFDALQIMVDEAHRLDLRLEAWINPYRIRADAAAASARPLSADNPANDYLDAGSDVVLEYNGGYFYNPGSAEARRLIVSGVEEIVENYAVDGIHFDDYFYPSGASASFDRETYQASGTSKGLAAWRREQVNLLIKQVYNAVGSDKVFGVSPAGNNANNYDLLYCDVASWLSAPGYVDYICPQVYFAFGNSTCPYKDTVRLFNDLIKQSSGVTLIVGLAAYKIGDSTYGSEWTNNSDMMKRQVEYARTLSRYDGFALYRYDFVVSEKAQIKTEMSNLMDILD